MTFSEPPPSRVVIDASGPKHRRRGCTTLQEAIMAARGTRSMSPVLPSPPMPSRRAAANCIGRPWASKAGGATAPLPLRKEDDWWEPSRGEIDEQGHQDGVDGCGLVGCGLAVWQPLRSYRRETAAGGSL